MNLFRKNFLSCLILIFTFFITISNGATSIAPAGRSYSCSVINDNKLYVFGGDPFGIIGTPQTLYLDISLIGTPNPWYLLSDIPISVSAANAVFNGNNTVFLIFFNTVYAYNISNNQWYPTGSNGINAVGDNIQGRQLFTAVLAPDGNIIIYGGNNVINSPIPTMATLNTNISPYTWTANKTGQGAPQYITGHVAAINGTHMIIALGATSKNGTFELTNSSTLNSNLNYDIYALNIQTNVWSVNSTLPTSIPSMPPTPSSNIGVILGVIIAVVIVIFACVLVFAFCRKYKKDKNIIPTPGSRDYQQQR
ncbi:18992_t:CDS:2 [Gigaspora margarita]|uniref:18992_t:CDS:1 n=1 Tax=Gigaspora margarita TaxID=4874 RepID=A0ABN7VRM9_GIGMA|nr:18992_t:CDS:2 [Gigaspora margarita]